MNFRRVAEPKLDKLNPKCSLGGLEPGEYSRSENWPGEEDSLVSPHFTRRDNDLLGRKIKTRPLEEYERRVFPKHNPQKTAALRGVLRQLINEGFTVL